MRRILAITLAAAALISLGCYRLPVPSKDASATPIDVAKPPHDMAKSCKPCGDTCTPSIWGVCEDGCCVCRPPDGGKCPAL